MLTAALSLAPASGVHAQQQHSLPLVNSADRSQAGLVRIINRSDEAGTVRIHAIDDDGDRFGPIDLSIGRLATVQFNSSELEGGNTAKGLSGGVGNGDGDWRLELTSDLDIEALAYIRTDTGFLTTVHDVAQVELVEGSIAAEDSLLYRVQFFNPGNNSSQVSRLRLINLMGVRERGDDLGTGRPGRRGAGRRRDGHPGATRGAHDHRGAARVRRRRHRGQPGNREGQVAALPLSQGDGSRWGPPHPGGEPAQRHRHRTRGQPVVQRARQRPDPGRRRRRLHHRRSRRRRSESRRQPRQL